MRGVVFMGIFAEGFGLYIFARRPGGGRVIGASLRWRSLFFWWDFGVFFGLEKSFCYICVVWMTWYLPFLGQNSPNLGLLYAG